MKAISRSTLINLAVYGGRRSVFPGRSLRGPRRYRKSASTERSDFAALEVSPGLCATIAAPTAISGPRCNQPPLGARTHKCYYHALRRNWNPPAWRRDPTCWAPQDFTSASDFTRAEDDNNNDRFTWMRPQGVAGFSVSRGPSASEDT